MRKKENMKKKERKKRDVRKKKKDEKLQKRTRKRSDESFAISKANLVFMLSSFMRFFCYTCHKYFDVLFYL